jgi:hypothetical protein
VPLADRPTAPKQRGPLCSIGALLDKLPADDRDTLNNWLAADPTDVQSSVIARNLTAEGWRTTPDTVRHHRNGECRCGTR